MLVEKYMKSSFPCVFVRTKNTVINFAWTFLNHLIPSFYNRGTHPPKKISKYRTNTLYAYCLEVHVQMHTHTDTSVSILRKSMSDRHTFMHKLQVKFKTQSAT